MRFKVKKNSFGAFVFLPSSEGSKCVFCEPS